LAQWTGSDREKVRHPQVFVCEQELSDRNKESTSEPQSTCGSLHTGYSGRRIQLQLCSGAHSRHTGRRLVYVTLQLPLVDNLIGLDAPTDPPDLGSESAAYTWYISLAYRSEKRLLLAS